MLGLGWRVASECRWAERRPPAAELLGSGEREASVYSPERIPVERQEAERPEMMADPCPLEGPS